MSNLLETIHSPTDVKQLSLAQLETLAAEIRERLIIGVSKTGGHIGPNLGVVELTIAMHYVFDTPKDSFVFDVKPSGLRCTSCSPVARIVSTPFASPMD